MTTLQPLPPDKVAWADGVPRCPWCSEPADEARVSLEAIAWAFSDGSFSRVHRAPDGTPEGCALTVDCPSCRKPFAIAFYEGRDSVARMRTVALRTEADARLARGLG